MKLVCGALLAVCAMCSVAQESLPAPLNVAKGDPVRGRAIVLNRQVGMCLLCHSGPFPEEPLQGDLAPDLRGTGARWSQAQLRARIVDPMRLNPATIMPAYGGTESLWRVAPAFRGQPLLTPQQIEDVVVFLATLHE